MRGRMMLMLIGLCLPALLGCVGFASRRSPGPQPLPQPWRPRQVLREKLAVSGSGTVVVDDKDGLSPDEAALMALDHNPRLQALRSRRGLARSEVMAAGLLPNPRFEGSLETPASGSEATVLGYGAGVSWNVTPLLSRTAGVEAAKENEVSVDLEVAWQEWQVAQSARLHAARGIFLSRRIKLAREIVQQRQVRLDRLRQARASRAITRIEVTRAQRSLADARVAKLELEQQHVVEITALDQAIGLDPQARPLLDGTWTLPAQGSSLEERLEALPRRRLDLLALQHAHRSRDAAVEKAILERFPPLEIGLETSRDVDRVGAAGITLAIEIPFFKRNQDQVARRRIERDQIEAEWEARLSKARADIVRLTQEIGLVQRQMAVANEAADSASHLADLTRTTARSGALDPLLTADISEHALAARLREFTIEQLLVELRLALIMASGTEGRPSSPIH